MTSIAGTQPLRPAEGLYDPAYEHDACGVAMVATLTARPSHDIIAQGLVALRNLDHRGATGSDPKTGDGAGILLQVPDAFLRAEVDFELPRAGAYAVGNAFLPTEPDLCAKAKASIEQIAAEENLTVLGWRVVRTDASSLSDLSRSNMPYFEQLFVTAKGAPLQGIALDRRAYCLRRRVQHEVGIYFASLSGRTLVYKGMLTTEQLELVYPELNDERMASALAIVHSRFSTNTFPAWELAHPFRMIAHNGEINTVKGNRNWMRAREALLASDVIPGDLERLFPICTPDASDSASFDEVVELLNLGGRSLPHAMLMMIPEAWENNPTMDPKRRDFYAFHSCLMEPWDGPAGVVFTDGTQIGAVLDRNGLRPGRFWVTDDGLVVLASETGVLDIPAEKIVQKGRLQPGRMFLADLSQHRIVSDDEIKASLAAAAPYGEWLLAGRMLLSDLPEREHVVHTHASVTRRQQVFGYTEEELRLILAPMASGGAEPIGSMGTDTPIAALSDKPRLLFDYFSQLFAQVTNPPLDAIREELVTSLWNTIGAERNLLDPGPASCRRLVLPFPVLDNDALSKIVRINREGDLPGYQTYVARGLYEVSGGAAALTAKLDELCAEISAAIENGARIILLSDRHSNAELAPIPSLLFTAAVHHHLVREKSRTQVGLVVEAGDVREVHHVALLIGYGAAGGQPVPGHRDGRGPGPARGLHQRRAGEGRDQRGQGARQGCAQGDEQDGRLHGRLLHRGADLRGARPVPGGGRPVLHRHHQQARRGHPGADRRGGAPAAPHRVPGRRHPAGPPAAAGRRGVPVAARGRAAPVRPGDGVPAAALDPDRALRHLQAVHRPHRRPVRAADDAARAADVRLRPAAGADRGGRTGQRDRQAVLHRGDVVRLDQRRGPPDPGHRDEPDRRQVQHRRGRGGQGPALRPGAAQRGQAGRLRPVRGDLGLPDQRDRTCRSRWRRGPSRARAASCRGRRSTRGWPRPGTPRRGWG